MEVTLRDASVQFPVGLFATGAREYYPIRDQGKLCLSESADRHNLVGTVPGVVEHDTRYRFKPGESVRITSGEHAGKVGKVETRSAHWMEGHTVHQEPGYHLVMEDQAWVDAGWWMVESA